MSGVPNKDSLTTLVSTPPAGTPGVTADGRAYDRDREPNDDLALWMPEPPQAGDAVYCCGERVGTFRGDPNVAGGWYIETVPTRQMPARLADEIRKSHTFPLEQGREEVAAPTNASRLNPNSHHP